MKERFSFGLSTYHLWNRTDNSRTQDDRLRLGEPDPRRLMRDDCQSSFVAEVTVYHREDPLADEPFEHVKYCWGYRGHVFSTRLVGFWLRPFSLKRPALNSERVLKI